jgi:DNA polymerase III delta prime subunit
MHHALLYEGTLEWALSLIPPIAGAEGPDVIHFKGARMGIDDARKLIEAAYQTPLVGSERHFVLAFPEFTLEAQNALLKIVEEPPKTAYIYVVTSRKGGLLPTLISRLVHIGSESLSDTDISFEEFAIASHRERLEKIADRAAKKDDEWMLAMMSGIESRAEKSGDKIFIRAVTDLRPFFGTPGASKKMILEHLALLLPRG